MTDAPPRTAATLADKALIGSFVTSTGVRRWVAWIPHEGGELFDSNPEALAHVKSRLLERAGGRPAPHSEA